MSSAVCRNENVDPLREWTPEATMFSLGYLLLEGSSKLACRCVADVTCSLSPGLQAAVRFQFIKHSV